MNIEEEDYEEYLIVDENFKDEFQIDSAPELIEEVTPVDCCDQDDNKIGNQNLEDEDEDVENDEELCPVCLDLLPKPDQVIPRETRATQYLARTKPCNHYYHDFCIKEWSKKANTCPQCRSNFNIIELLSESKVIETINVENAKFPLEFDESDFSIPQEYIQEDALVNNALPEFRHQHLVNPICCLCDSSSRSTFAICTDCSSGYHISCLGLMDASHFHCPMCDSLQGRDSIVQNRRRGRRANGADTPTRRVGVMSTFLQDFRRQIRNDRYSHLGIEVPQRRAVRRAAINRSTRLNGNANARRSTGFNDDDEVDYVELADRNKRMMANKKRDTNSSNKNTEESIAWKILDSLTHQDDKPNGIKSPQRVQTPTSRVEKFKRPKRALRHIDHQLLQSNNKNSHNTIPAIPNSSQVTAADKSIQIEIENLPRTSLQLTEEALSIHEQVLNRTTPPRKHPVHSNSFSSPQGSFPISSAVPSNIASLSYTQKLIVQRLLIKPKIKPLNLSTLKYTALNKQISRKVYKLIIRNNDAFHWLNLMEELSERENLDLKDKSQMEFFLLHESVTSNKGKDSVNDDSKIKLEDTDDDKNNIFTKDNFLNCFGRIVGELVIEELDNSS